MFPQTSCWGKKLPLLSLNALSPMRHREAGSPTGAGVRDSRAFRRLPGDPLPAVRCGPRLVFSPIGVLLRSFQFGFSFSSPHCYPPSSQRRRCHFFVCETKTEVTEGRTPFRSSQSSAGVAWSPDHDRSFLSCTDPAGRPKRMWFT